MNILMWTPSESTLIDKAFVLRPTNVGHGLFLCPIKNKLNKGAQVMISGNYKKGLLSSVMIKNYSID